ncbi:MAG: RNA polymerase subunit sigma-24 [endosymbiont of Galathealinum brachiosum]|uniref:RNA polymerase sigma factor n=1 Tax=endosymbiont of Galathealinum brachiosum TaxID=2200906 RepID=A0A370DD71_9GAMM|nr:MAG: RNA polymerase subunit sigma-24 [endosymbiont of Galathealinum brachiosum]
MNKPKTFYIYYRYMIKRKSTVKTKIAASRDRLYRVALAWCGDQMLAEDLIQETIAIGIDKSHQLRNEDQLFSWLYTILNNNWYRHLRKNKNHEDISDLIPSEDSGPYTTCQELLIVKQVQQVVATLPSVERQVISLVDLEEFSYSDVAKVLDIPIGTVMSRLHRARKNLLLKMDSTACEPAKPTSHIHRVK